MIEKHLHAVFRTHEGDLVALSNGCIKEDIVFIFLNTVWDRVKWNLHYLKSN